MHWIGAVFTATSPPHEASRSYRLVADFDGVVFLGHVDPEIVDEIGEDRGE